MTVRRVYRVGGHSFVIDCPEGTLSEKELEPYALFQTDSYSRDDSLFILSLTDEAEVPLSEGEAVADLEDDNGRMTIYSHGDGPLTFCLSPVSGSECGRIRISEDYRTAEAWIGGTAGERRYALDTALMLLYTFASSRHDTLMLHASAVEYDGKGYIFLGRSGTGKSTHSRLWTEHIAGAQLLNDDNPILRAVGGTVYVAGSPWSGKTPCYRSRMIPAGGIVRLRQAPFNRITALTGVKAYAALMPSCSCMRWDRGMAEAVHSTLCRIIDTVPVYSLECLPDQEAAELCRDTLTRDNE